MANRLEEYKQIVQLWGSLEDYLEEQRRCALLQLESSTDFVAPDLEASNRENLPGRFLRLLRTITKPSKPLIENV